MNIAIMGAGLSGLSCAITLEKHGVKPTIFESRGVVGDRFVYGELILNLMNKPVNNPLSFLNDKYNIFLNPISEVKNLIIHSKNSVSEVRENLGIMNLRGRREDSFDSQLYRQVKSKVVFNSKETHSELKDNFSHVVLATGDADYAVKLGNYRPDFTVTLKGATIKGKFKVNTCHAWFNHDFVPKGYAYLIPFSSDEANIVLAFPDHPENNAKDIDELFKKYFSQVSVDLNQDFQKTDDFQVRKYVIGLCNSPKIDNTYFVGNCFGAITPFLGFGQFNSILTGIYAAQDILGLCDYSELTKDFFTEYENSLKLRKKMESLNESQLDLLVKSVGTFPLNNFARYSLGKNSSFNALKFISKFIKS